MRGFGVYYCEVQRVGRSVATRTPTVEQTRTVPCIPLTRHFSKRHRDKCHQILLLGIISPRS